ncbi:MAG TPA: maltose alpha-D-glucosyltransferase [Anaerolineae bacterium]|nr:maltose alpha-D-glucosyltransferase [Anaerolineae bacterium]
MSSIPWWKTAVFYQIYPRSFQDSNGDGIGDIPGIIARLDYLRDLGVDAFWISPHYPSPRVDDGYDIADFYNVHPDYGTLEDFQRLVDEAHARGIRVLADLVLNHTSDQHPWFQASRRRQDPYTDWYVWSDTNDRYRNARIIFLDTESSNWAWDDVRKQYYWHRFYTQQPDLNYDNPQVQEEMLNVVRFWLDLGLDGYRMDAVPYLFEREGTNCESLPETHAYLKRVRREVEATYPDAVLLCEANQPLDDLRAYFGGDPADPSVPGDELHMGFHFALMPRLFMAIKRGERTPIVDILRRTPPIPANCQWCTFLRNHDELTLEMVTPEERAWMWDQYAPEPRMRLNLGIRRRLAPLLDNDHRTIELMHALIFALPGSPIIYYGDEIGMGDNIWLPDRNGVRTPMQWDDSPNAGFSTAATLPTPVIDDPIYGYRRVNVAAQQADPDSLWHRLRRMIRIYKALPALALGDLAFLEDQPPAVLAFRRHWEGDTILAYHNLSDRPQTIFLPPGQDAMSGQTLSAGDYRLPPYAYLWLRATG